MFPRPTMHEAPDNGLADAIFSRQFDLGNLAGIVARTDLDGLSVRQLRAAIALATRGALGMLLHPVATLVRHILDVVFLGANEQVCGVDALLIVPAGAVVADVQFVRDGTVGQDVGDPGGRMALAPSPADMEIAAPLAPDRRYPEPAPLGAGRLIDLLPETLLDRTTRAGKVRACRVAETAVDMLVGVGDRLAALFARAGILNAWHFDLLDRSKCRRAEGCHQHPLGFMLSANYTTSTPILHGDPA